MPCNYCQTSVANIGAPGKFCGLADCPFIEYNTDDSFKTKDAIYERPTQMRLLLFAGMCYYPDGGALDFKAGAEQTPELKEKFKEWLKSEASWATVAEAVEYRWGMIVRASDMQVLEVIGSSITFDWDTTTDWIPYPGKQK
jgi:hypothetical protein